MMTMLDRICLITGGTNGIGKSTAQGLARMGATVVIVGRNAQKTSQVVEEIRAASGNHTVDSLLADLSSQQEVRRLASDFKSKYPQLHVLLNNAGGTFTTRQLSVDGIEMTFALNYLAYFLLTNLLLDTLRASTPARIINTSSRSHARAQINFDDLQSRSSYRGLRAYAQSKLAIVLFTYELARRLEGTGVTVNALHPGTVATNFAKENPGALSLSMRLFRPAFLSPERGAQTSIYLATSPEVEGVTGKYFVKQKAIPSSPASYDTATASRLWQVSVEMTRLSVSIA